MLLLLLVGEPGEEKQQLKRQGFLTYSQSVVEKQRNRFNIDGWNRRF